MLLLSLFLDGCNSSQNQNGKELEKTSQVAVDEEMQEENKIPDSSIQFLKPIEGSVYAIECKRIRDNVEVLVDEYSGANEERRSEILMEIDALGRQWNQGCRSVFGDRYSITNNAPESIQEIAKLLDAP